MGASPVDSVLARFTINDVVRPVLDLQTYKNLVYFVVAVPLGIAYTYVLGFGFVLGIGLSVVLVGIGVLLGLVFVIRGLTTFERWLTRRLLDASIESSADSTAGESLRARLRSSLAAETTWRGLGFLTLKIWLGVIGVVLLLAFSRVLSLLSVAFRLPHQVTFGEVNGTPVTWTVQTLPEAAIAVAVGLVVGLFLLHLTNWFASVTCLIAEALL